VHGFAHTVATRIRGGQGSAKTAASSTTTISPSKEFKRFSTKTAPLQGNKNMEKQCFCSKKFEDNTKNKNRKYCSEKCREKVKALKKAGRLEELE